MKAACVAVLALGASLRLCLASPSGSMVRRQVGRPALDVGKPGLQAALEQLLVGEAVRRIFDVEASVRPTYEALPKNSAGRIPPEILPGIVRNYFAKEHGWLIKGLEPPNFKATASQVHEALILQEHASGLADVLKGIQESDQGLSLSEVVGVIAALEKMILGQSVVVLQGAYALNELSTADAVDEHALSELLHSYLLLFRHGHPHNFTDAPGHQRMKARAQMAEDWAELVKFAHEAVLNSAHKGPYSFIAVSEIVKGLAQKYGKWQNSECIQMKATLMRLGTDSSGSVLLADFHSEPGHNSYQFTESAEYLRKTGSLEEDAEGSKQRVRIANYLLGPSNCIASSEYYSVCCLSECEELMSNLEEQIKEPAWPPQRLLELAGATPSSSVLAPRKLPATLAHDLDAIAGRHEGSVPLHSADFKGWLHRAFPNECPAPTAAENVAEESERTALSEWADIQQECTRIPRWHPAAQEELLSI